jgi:hypothetical protein
MKKKQQIRTCDICGKTVSDEGEIYFGGHPFYGWFTVNMHGGPTDLESLHAPHDWDICSKQCMIKFARNDYEKKSSR